MSRHPLRPWRIALLMHSLNPRGGVVHTLELADALLANPGLKIEGVALSLGFNDAAAFSRALKRRTGKTPGAYRKGLQSCLVRTNADP